MPGKRSQEGSRFSTFAIVSETSSPSKARRARQHLVEHASKSPDVTAFVCGLPFACSGAMYAAVPRITPTPVIIAGDVIVGELRRAAGVDRRHRLQSPSRARSPGP